MIRRAASKLNALRRMAARLREPLQAYQVTGKADDRAREPKSQPPIGERARSRPPWRERVEPAATASPAGRTSTSPRRAWPRPIAPAPCSRPKAAISTCAFTSTLKRAHNTLDIILDELGQADIPTVKDAALERARLRRAGRHQQGRGAQALGRLSRCISGSAPTTSPRPAASSLKDTAARVVPFFEKCDRARAARPART